MSLSRPGALWLFIVAAPAAAEEPERAQRSSEAVSELIVKLDDPDQAPDALEALVAIGDEASPALAAFASQRGDLSARGRAILALSRIGGEGAGGALAELRQDDDPLIKVWAGAAQIAICEDLDALLPLATTTRYEVALSRPLQLKALALADGAALGDLLRAAAEAPHLQASLSEAILGFGAASLMEETLTHPDQAVRRQAAAYVATLGQRDPSVQRSVLDAFDYTRDREAPPWWGGPLWIPGLSWGRGEARELVGHLIAWDLYCDRNGYEDAQVQIQNNLRSVGLTRAAGMGDLYDLTTASLLVAWGNAEGRDALEAMLKEQGLHRDREYKLLLNQLD